MECPPTITSDWLKLKIASKSGREELFQVRGDEALLIANVLDQILNESGLQEKERNRYSVTLQKLCGACCILPESHIISDGLEVTSASPVASGGFADVYLGSYEGRSVAIKTIRMTLVDADKLGRLKKPLFKEAVGWKYFSHPNVLSFLGASIDLFSLSLVSPWMDIGNINQFTKSHPDTNRLNLLADVAKGVEYLHSIKVIHGDLKGANILISSENHALLADFGLMNVVSDLGSSCTKTSSFAGGTTRWMSPELLLPDEIDLRSRNQTTGSDIYALGMVILEVLTDKQPFFEMKRDQTVVVHVVTGNLPARPVNSLNMGISDDLWQILLNCWTRETIERPGVKVVRVFLEEAIPSWHSRPPPVEVPSLDAEDIHSEASWSTVSVARTTGLTDQHPDDDLNINHNTVAVRFAEIPAALEVPSVPRALTFVSRSPEKHTPKDNKRSLSTFLLKKSSILLETAIFFDQVRGVKDLDKHIDMHHTLFELFPRHPWHLFFSMDLSNQLIARFNQDGNMGDLEHAIKLQYGFLQRCPRENWQYRSRALCCLGESLLSRFDREGNMQDLEHAIALLYECFEMCYPGHPYRSSVLYMLGFAFRIRFQFKGSMADIDQAIKLHRALLERRPRKHRHRFVALCHLGLDSVTRFERTRELEDLEEAITLHRECLELHPPVGSEFEPGRLISALDNLAQALRNRCSRQSNVEDLQKAIDLQQQQLKLLPSRYIYRWVALADSGCSRHAHSETSGGLEELERTIELHRSTLELQPRGQSQRWDFLQRLGTCLCRRFDWKGEMQDIDEAIVMYRESLEVCYPHYPQRSQILDALEFLLRRHSDIFGVQAEGG